jgi:hypothetical protein
MSQIPIHRTLTGKLINSTGARMGYYLVLPDQFRPITLYMPTNLSAQADNLFGRIVTVSGTTPNPESKVLYVEQIGSAPTPPQSDKAVSNSPTP